MVINESIANTTLKRAKFFQTVQAWPLTDDFNYTGWLSNFKTNKDQELACLILDTFMYFSLKQVNKIFLNSLELAGSKLARLIPDWTHSDFFNRCIYSYIPGETLNISDSGFGFARKLKEVAGIPENRLFEYNKIPEVLDSFKKPTPVILVDDFIGSGAQCSQAWNENPVGRSMKTLSEISDYGNHVFVYAPLIVNYIGYDRIIKDCKGLHLTPTHILGPEYNLFNKSCYCWKGDENLYNAGIEMILRKSRELDIPSTDGRHTQDEKGFGKQGLALKFEHGAPDAIPAFFYWCHDNWIPLFYKNYIR